MSGRLEYIEERITDLENQHHDERAAERITALETKLATLEGQVDELKAARLALEATAHSHDSSGHVFLPRPRPHPRPRPVPEHDERLDARSAPLESAGDLWWSPEGRAGLALAAGARPMLRSMGYMKHGEWVNHSGAVCPLDLPHNAIVEIDWDPNLGSVVGKAGALSWDLISRYRVVGFVLPEEGA